MIISSTSVSLSSVFDKIDVFAIEAAVANLHFPPLIITEFEKLVITVIARGDDVYPEEHYRIGTTLYVALQFDPEQLSCLSTEAVTQLVCDKTAAYLPTIREVEEREMQIVDWE